MTFTEIMYTCLTCHQQYGDGYAALQCHRRGWIRKPIELLEYDLESLSLLILATAVSAGWHNN